MTPGCWYRISGDHPDLDLPATRRGTRYLEDNDPAKDNRLNPARTAREIARRLLGRAPRAPWSGRCGFASITEAWNGAVFASSFGASGSMIIFGGGHNDYFGSDVHAFDLETRQWSRIFDGYTSGTADEYGGGAVYQDTMYPDGSPLPPHTYGYVQYDSVGNDYLLLKGQTELGPHPKSAPVPHMFNLDTLKWRHGPSHPTAVLGSGGWSAWDPQRRILWGHSGDNGNGFVGFSPDGKNDDVTFGSWTALYPKKLTKNADHNVMAYNPVRDINVMISGAENRLYAIDPAQPGREIAPLSATSDQPVLSEYAALEYAPNLDCFVYYSANNGAQLFSIAVARGSNDWRWRGLLSDENRLDPTADAAGLSKHCMNRDHTFGRFRVASYDHTDIAILVRHIDTPVYCLRLR